jgi:NUMOD4 motif
MDEQWRDVSGYDGIYQISDQGHVRNTHTSKILQPIKMKNGILHVTLSSGYSVNLTKRVQTPNGMRYCPVAQSRFVERPFMICYVFGAIPTSSASASQCLGWGR